MPHADPERRRQYKREAERRRRARKRVERERERAEQTARRAEQTPPDPGEPVVTAEQLRQVLGRLIAAAAADPEAGPLERLRAVAYGVERQLRVLEAADLAGRVAALEDAEQRRRGNSAAAPRIGHPRPSLVPSQKR